MQMQNACKDFCSVIEQRWAVLTQDHIGMILGSMLARRTLASSESIILSGTEPGPSGEIKIPASGRIKLLAPPSNLVPALKWTGRHGPADNRSNAKSDQVH